MLMANVDHDAHAVAIAFVAEVGDALDLLVAHEIGDLLDEAGFVHLVRKLGDDELSTAAAAFLDRRAGVHGDAPVAFAVGVLHVLAVLADERDPGGGEIGALDDLENVVERRLGVVEQPCRPRFRRSR